jgi:hypothetical protein
MASFTADGNIPPCRFVMFQTTGNIVGRVVVAGNASQIAGISEEGTHQFPGLGIDDGYAAIQNYDLVVHVTGERCLLELSGIVTLGQRIKADVANGTGVAATADGAEFGAIALANGISGQLIPVYVTGPASGMRGA